MALQNMLVSPQEMRGFAFSSISLHKTEGFA